MARRLAALFVALLMLLPAFAVAESPERAVAADVQADEVSGLESDVLDVILLEGDVDIPEISAEEAEIQDGSADPAEEGVDPQMEEAGQVEEPAQQEAPAQEDPAQEEEPAQDEPSIFGDPIAVKTIKVTKTASKSVYLGIPYALDVKGGIKSTKSDAKKVATVAKDGVVTLKKKGTAKITITRTKGKKLTLTLKVKAVPAPDSPKITASSGRFTLKWDAAKYATGYLAQSSPDGKDWKDVGVLEATARSLDVTEAVNGTTYFRVVAILGDKFGGVSATVSALAPITDVAVICQEDASTGPTDKMNVTWSPCGGAEAYEVYRATLPEDDYQLLGTTTNTWYADKRSAKKLYAYRVKPVVSGLDLPMSEPATLWSGMKSNVLPPKKLKSKTGIILVVNKQAQVVTAYIKDADGKYTLPLRHMICSTGRVYDRTKNGTWKIESHKGEWYTYPGPSGDTIRWPSVYRSGYYFHSTLYNRDHTIRSGSVNKLGSRASAGCIRLKVSDAKWVYKNCPNGTPVYICDGKKIKALNKALKPKKVKVKGF